ncbi:hypothetical protein B0H13DRAFT_1853605 [Mycena leptocephala]|nr:hypothetical protein B0H13DRAFT_1853605 [Mycena leptocephala]
MSRVFFEHPEMVVAYTPLPGKNPQCPPVHWRGCVLRSGEYSAGGAVKKRKEAGWRVHKVKERFDAGLPPAQGRWASKAEVAWRDCSVRRNVQDESFILKEGCIYGTHVYVFVYSIVSRRSFDLVRILYDEIFGLTEHRSPNSVEGIELAKEKNSAWIETTSKADINIDKIFEYCVAEVQKMALSSGGVEGQSSLRNNQVNLVPT